MCIEIDTIMPTPAAFARADDAVEVGGKVRNVQMAVMIDEHGAVPLSPSPSMGRGSG